MSTEKKTEGCVFAIYGEVFGWHPDMEAPRLLVKRSSHVSALAYAYNGTGVYDSENSPSFWDATVTGNVHRDLGPQASFGNAGTICGILDYSYEPDRLSNLFVDYSSKSPRVLLLEYDDNSREISFGRPDGVTIKTIPSSESTYLPMGITVDGRVFWSQDDRVYWDMDRSKTDVRFISSCIRLLPLGSTFLCCHYLNEMTHPEGVVISTRDRRTVYSWDPDVFGLPGVVGLYRKEGKTQLLFTGSKPGKGNEERVIGVYTTPLRASTGEGHRYPCKIMEKTVTGSTAHFINPFLACSSSGFIQMIRKGK